MEETPCIAFLRAENGPLEDEVAASGGCSCPTLISRWPQGSFILQVGQKPLQDQKVTLAVLTEGVFSRSSGPGCAWCSGQWGQGSRRSEVSGDHICFGACGWKVRGTLTLAGAGGRLCCTSVGVSPDSRATQGCEQEQFLPPPSASRCFSLRPAVLGLTLLSCHALKNVTSPS